MNTQTNTDSQASSPEVKPLFRLIPWVILLAGLSAVLLVIFNWDSHEAGKMIQTTNNSTVRQDNSSLTAKSGGYVKNVYFHDFDRVKAGQLLLQLVDDDYQASLASARATQLKAEAQLSNLRNEIEKQQALINQSAANVRLSDAKYKQAAADDRRYRGLTSSGAVTKQDADNASFTVQQALATLASSQADVDVQKKQLQVLEGERQQRQADVLSAQASVRTAEINLGYTRIIAPSDGVMGERNIQPGNLVSTGTTIANFVSASAPYIISNYKETQLARIRPGQPVEIEVDSLPGQKLQGRVSLLSPATGSTFAILPADNATGNFTKVTQRVPVRIDIVAEQKTAELLRAGMSVTTHIDTTGVE